jgi:hypothetical protein
LLFILFFLGFNCDIYRVGSHPSSPKTLPPTTMGFGGTGTDADLYNQFSHIKETGVLQKKKGSPNQNFLLKSDIGDYHEMFC